MARWTPRRLDGIVGDARGCAEDATPPTDRRRHHERVEEADRMVCFAIREQRKGCGEATHVWLEPGRKSAHVYTPVCDVHAEVGRKRGHTVRPFKRTRLARATAARRSQ